MDTPRRCPLDQLGQDSTRHPDLEVSAAASGAVSAVAVAEASVGVVDSVVVTVSVLVEESATKVAEMDSVVVGNHLPMLPLVLVVAAGEISEVVEEISEVVEETLEVAGETTVVVADSIVEVAATGSLYAHEMALRTGTAATTGTVIATEIAIAVMTVMEETATGTVTATDMAAEMLVETLAETLAATLAEMPAEMPAGRTLDGSDPVKTMATMTPDPGDDTKCSPSCEWMLLSPFSALTCWWVSLLWPSRVLLFSRVMG